MRPASVMEVHHDEQYNTVQALPADVQQRVAKGKGRAMDPPAVPLRTKTNKVAAGSNKQRVSACVHSLRDE